MATIEELDLTIPPAIRAGLDRYQLGIPTGDCLRAILSGDLYAAFARADPDTTAAMPAIVGYIVRHLPTASYGDPKRVAVWLARHAAELAAGRAAR